MTINIPDKTNFLDSLGKASLLSARILSILENPDNIHHAKLIRILPRIASFYEHFSGGIMFDSTIPPLHHRNLFSENSINRYFSPEFLLELEGRDLEREILVMENISEYITTSFAAHPIGRYPGDGLGNPIPVAYLVYALYRTGLNQNEIANFFCAPTNRPQVLFPLPDDFRARFNCLINKLHIDNLGGSQALLGLFINLHRRGQAGNFRVALLSLPPFNFFNFLERHWDLFERVLMRENSNTVEAFIPLLSRLFPVIPNSFDREQEDRLLEAILIIIRSGQPRKLTIAIGEPLKFARLLRGVNFNLQTLTERLGQVPNDSHRLNLFRLALRELDVESIGHILNNRYFSFQEILNLPQPAFLNAMKFLNALYSNSDVENGLLPESIRKFLIYDYNNQTPGYQANFNGNLERVRETIESIGASGELNLGSFDDCLGVLGVTFDNMVTLRPAQPEKFRFLISFVKRLLKIDDQTEQANFIRDYSFLFNKSIGRASEDAYSFAEIMNNPAIGTTEISDCKTSLDCLLYTRSPFQDIATLEDENLSNERFINEKTVEINKKMFEIDKIQKSMKPEELTSEENEEIERKELEKQRLEMAKSEAEAGQARRTKAIRSSRSLQSEIIQELSTLSPLIQYLFVQSISFIPLDFTTTSNSVAKNIQDICETYFPQFKKIQKQVNFETEMLSIIKELKKRLETRMQRGTRTFLDRIIAMYASSADLEEFLEIFKYSSSYTMFQEICSPTKSILPILDAINATLQPLVKNQNVFELTAPQLLFTGKCESALNKLKIALGGNAGALLREFILRLEQDNVQGSAADFIRTVAFGTEFIDKIIAEINRYVLELDPINDGARDLLTSLGLSEKEILFTRLENIRCVPTAVVQEMLGGIARSEKFWTQKHNVDGKPGYSENAIKRGAFHHSFVAWSEHMLSRAELYNPYGARFSFESSAGHDFLFLLGQQDIIDRLNNLRQHEDQAPYKELLEALVRFVKRLEPTESKPSQHPRTFWECEMQDLSVDDQVTKLVELSRAEIASEIKVASKPASTSTELELGRAEVLGNESLKEMPSQN